jgi:organic hydroperoxide reductase OsmC/OhrA
MERAHTYRVTAWWVAGQNGIARSDAAPNAIQFTVPTQFGGMEGRWSPEDLFLASIASCFTTTFNAIAGLAKFPYVDLEVEIDGAVAKTESGYGFTEVLVQPTLRIANATDAATALQLLNKTETLCLVLRILEIPRQFRPRVEVQNIVSTGEPLGPAGR